MDSRLRGNDTEGVIFGGLPQAQKETLECVHPPLFGHLV
jgi:hypothetical protein